MFVFPKQETFNIAGVKVGGQMNNPCVLIGTIFYKGEGVFLDNRCVKFDDKKVENIINDLENLKEDTGLPFMIDIYAESSEDIKDRIDFVSDMTNVPFLIDSTDAEVRISGIVHAEEVGLIDRTVYNSIGAGVTEDEIKKLKESSIGSSILLAFNPADSSMNGKMELLKNGSKVLSRGLLEIADGCGIKKVMIDTGIMPLGAGAGSALWSIMVTKSRFGLPTGNGIHNIVSEWPWLKGKSVKKVVDASSNILPRIVGADFLLFGPIENAEMVFSCVALTECLIAEIMEERGIAINKEHPYKKLV